MSYDLHLFRHESGTDLLTAARTSYRADVVDLNDGPIDPAAEARKQAIAAALMAEDPRLQPFAFDHEQIARLQETTVEEARRRWRHIELNGPEDGPGVQIMLFDATASVTVPYWHDGDRAGPVWADIRRYLRVLEQVGGFRTYDPQSDRVIELEGDFDTAMAVYDKGVEFTNQVAVRLRDRNQRPWWRFW